MVTYLLSVPSSSCPLTCGVICHPSPRPQWWATITKPSLWHLSSHDVQFKDANIAELRKSFEPKQKEGVEFTCIVHPGM